MKQMFFSTSEMAERLGVDAKTVRKLASFQPHPPRGRIPARKIGRCIKFHIRDVEEWEKGRRSVRLQELD
jgi:excisionase family DNA binding protein